MQIPFISGISATAWTTLGSTIVVYLVNPIIVWIVVGLFIWLMFRIRSFFGYRSDEYRDARLRRDMERSLDRTLSDGAFRQRSSGAPYVEDFGGKVSKIDGGYEIRFNK